MDDQCYKDMEVNLPVVLCVCCNHTYVAFLVNTLFYIELSSFFVSPVAERLHGDIHLATPGNLPICI